MTRIKFDVNIIKIISLFESMTKAKVKDCIANERILFIVEKDEISKAIGKGGANVKRIEKALNRKIKIVEFNSNLIQFIKNLIYPLKSKDIKEEDKNIIITPIDNNTRGLLIGRAAQNLRGFEEIAKRYFDIEQIKII